MIPFIKLNVINVSDDNVINKDFTVSNNDKTINIKEKIFAYYRDPKSFWIPEYVSLSTERQLQEQKQDEQQDDLSDITLTTKSEEESSVLLKSNSLNIIEGQTIYAKNILNELRKLDFVNIYSDEYRMQSLYKSYKLIYTDLNEVVFNNAFKIIMYQFDKVQYNSFLEDIKTFSLEIIERQKKAIAKWTKIDGILNPVIELENKVSMDNKLSRILNLELVYNNGASVSKMFNIFNVFNNFSLTEKYIAVIANGSFVRKKEPILKIYDELPKGLTKGDIKDWIINEKKKDKVVFFKKVKGAIFKVIHNEILFNLVLNVNGDIEISFNSSSKINLYKEVEYSTIINYISEIYIDFVNYINSMDNVYNTNALLSETEFSYNITSLSGEIDTSLRIQKNAFSEFCLQKTVNENLFRLKDVKSLDSISLYYTKNIQDDTKGITVNIKDNLYTMDSSTITILDCRNITQYLLILKYIVVINYYNTNIIESLEDEPQKLKKKSTIKDLKKQGVETISTNCQKPRQPMVDENLEPKDGSYRLFWKNQTYVCPKEEFKYPGFTNKNIVCCFSKDQRRTAKYIKNLKSDELEIIVQASNYPIEVIKDGVKKKTLVIKLISGPEELTAKSDFPYFYLDFIEKDRLGIEPLTDKKIIEDIQRLEQESSIWLEPVALSHIITAAPKNKCNKTPDLTRGEMKKTNDLCSQHNVHKYFGYNQNSYPCCFDNPRDFVVALKRKDKDNILKQHILQNDKILDINRLGLLPEYIDGLFNKTETIYYRLGVIQNRDSFLNCVLMCIEKSFLSKKFSNTLELKNYLAEKIVSEKLFYKIYNGNLSQMWGTEELFVKDFISENVYVDYKIILDIVFNVLNLNVLIIDVNESSSEKSKIVCNNNFDKSFKTAILLKRNLNSIYNTPQFEILVELTKSNVQKTFSSELSFVNLLSRFVKTSCKSIDEYPENYEFIPFIKITDFEASDIETQITNGFNKVNWIILKSIPNLILPVEETSIQDNVMIKKFSEVKEFSTIQESDQSIERLNRIYSLNIKGLGIIKTDSYIDGLLLNYGLIIPVSKVKSEAERDKYQILEFKYYPTLDKSINFKVTNNSLQNFDSINKNIYNIKKNVAFNINKRGNEEMKSRIIDVIISNKYSNTKKLKMILEELDNLYKNNDNKFKFYLKIVINDMVSDTVKMSVINNNIVLNKFSTEKILKNENEVLILNFNEFVNYIKE